MKDLARFLVALLALLALVACESSSGEVTQDNLPCTRQCPQGQRCEYIGDTLSQICVDVPCDPACELGEECRTSVCVPSTAPDTSRPSARSPLTCGMALMCLENCGADSSCQEDCYDRMPYEEQLKFESLVRCLGENGCTDKACRESWCGDPLAACMGNSSGAGSGLTCDQVGPMGQCDGQVLSYCAGQELITRDCRALAPDCPCGLNAATGQNDCLCTSRAQTCLPPCPQGFSCQNGQCVPGGDGSTGCGGLPPGASQCDGGILRTCLGGQLMEQNCLELGCSCGPGPTGTAQCCP